MTGTHVTRREFARLAVLGVGGTVSSREASVHYFNTDEEMRPLVDAVRQLSRS